MSLLNLIKKGGLRELATATVATVATPVAVGCQLAAPLALVKCSERFANTPSYACTTVASVATVAVATAFDIADWQALDRVYLAHHFNCAICIAAGRGAFYGQRCGAGMALWHAYAKGTASARH